MNVAVVGRHNVSIKRLDGRPCDIGKVASINILFHHCPYAVLFIYLFLYINIINFLNKK